MNSTSTIQIDQFIPYSPTKVWRALTEPDLLALWFMPNDFKLEVGHRFTFQAVPLPNVKFSGTINCQVLNFEVERSLRIHWTDQAGGNNLNSTVTWRLEPEDNGTHLFLEHAGFDTSDPLQQLSYKMMSGGWQAMPGRIADLLASEEALQ